MATTRDIATGSRADTAVAVTAMCAGDVPAAESDAGAPNPISGPGEADASVGVADAGCGVLAVGCTGATVADGEGRACDGVQPVSANNAITAGQASVGQRCRTRGRLFEITNLLLSYDLTTC